jgi:hypothetical protein
MPTRNVYLSESDLPLWEQATRVAQQRGQSLSSVIIAQLTAWIDQAPSDHVQLYTTPALPQHYVALKPDGTRWLLPCAPLSPEAWAAAEPYRGNYTLTRVVPVAIEQYYQPA